MGTFVGASTADQKQAALLPGPCSGPVIRAAPHSLVNSLDTAGKSHMQGVWGPDDSEHMYE